MTNSLSKDLPEEVMIDILSRLTVKTLMRLRCVCKSWYATISHPNFITIHLNRACFYYDVNVLCMKYSNQIQRWCLLSHQTCVNHVESEIPFQCRSGCFEIVTTINGLVCLTDYCLFGSTIILWNPSIRKFKTLPYSSIASQLFLRYYSVVLGFGFHNKTNDYKVVRIFCFTENWDKFEKALPQLEVYSLRMDSWRRIEVVVPWCFHDGLSNAFINESVHWVAHRSVEDKRSDMIVSFDIGDEVFQEMMLPDYYIDGGGMLKLSLAVLNGSLSLCVCSFRGFWMSEHCHIWVMREYGVVESWTKQFTIVIPRGRVERCLGFTKNNELLLETTEELVSYDPKSLQLKHIGICDTDNITNAVPFMETLVLLDSVNALLGY